MAGTMIKFHEVESCLQQGIALAGNLYETYKACTDQERHQLKLGLLSDRLRSDHVGLRR